MQIHSILFIFAVISSFITLFGKWKTKNQKSRVKCSFYRQRDTFLDTSTFLSLDKTSVRAVNTDFT